MISLTIPTDSTDYSKAVIDTSDTSVAYTDLIVAGTVDNLFDTHSGTLDPYEFKDVYNTEYLGEQAYIYIEDIVDCGDLCPSIFSDFDCATETCIDEKAIIITSTFSGKGSYTTYRTKALVDYYIDANNGSYIEQFANNMKIHAYTNYSPYYDLSINKYNTSVYEFTVAFTVDVNPRYNFVITTGPKIGILCGGSARGLTDGDTISGNFNGCSYPEVELYWAAKLSYA